MKKVLCNLTLPEEVLAEFQNRLTIDIPAPEKGVELPADLLKKLDGYDALLVGGIPITRQMLETGSNLQAVGTVSVGFDHIDLPTANKRKIRVVNTPTTVTAATAELTMALLLDVTRGVRLLDAQVRTGQPVRLAAFPARMRALHGKTLGIIGMGRIGKAVAARARAFGMKILYTGHSPLNREEEQAFEAVYVDQDTLLAQADFVTLHCPGTPENFHLIDEAALARMKPDAVLINAARGDLVDEQALIQALQTGIIAGAALDVFEREPLVSPELTAMPQVVLTPHIGTYAYDVRVDMAREALTGLAEVLEGRLPYNVVNQNF